MIIIMIYNELLTLQHLSDDHSCSIISDTEEKKDFTVQFFYFLFFPSAHTG